MMWEFKTPQANLLVFLACFEKRDGFGGHFFCTLFGKKNPASNERQCEDKIMKQLLVLVFCSLFFSVGAGAQTEKFDIISFKTPTGWQKEAGKSAVQLGVDDSATGGMCLVTMFKPLPGSSDSKANFDAAWEAIVEKTVTVSGKPQMQSPVNENGWTAQSGAAAYEADGKKGVVLLVTMSGGNKMVNILVLTNTEQFQAAIGDFLESVDLPKVKAAVVKPKEQTKSPNLLTKYLWKSYQNRKDGMGNNAGYSTNIYQFYGNGTYKFSNTTFQFYVPKFYMVSENGTYQVNGNKITLKPAKSRFAVRQREKTGPVIKSGNFSLGVVQYGFEYTTIYDRLRLVLTPSSETETKRDGPFNYYANGAMTKSYLYDAETGSANRTADNRNSQPQARTSGSYKFSTTNFDDGWTSVEQENWVSVTKGTTKVLIHYPNKAADKHNFVLLDGLKNAWDILVAPRYSSASNLEFRPISGWQSIEFAEADMVERVTGKAVYVVLFNMNYSNGSGRYLEFIMPSKASFEGEFGAYSGKTYGWEKMEKMANYNKFGVAPSDLKGTWTNKYSGSLSYVNAYTGASAGTDTHASAQEFVFGAGNTYQWNLAVASGMVGNIKFQSVKASGQFSVTNNWQVKFSKIEGKPRTYDASFAAVKGARILWLDGTAYGRVK